MHPWGRTLWYTAAPTIWSTSDSRSRSDRQPRQPWRTGSYLSCRLKRRKGHPLSRRIMTTLVVPALALWSALHPPLNPLFCRKAAFPLHWSQASISLKTIYTRPSDRLSFLPLYYPCFKVIGPSPQINPNDYIRIREKGKDQSAMSGKGGAWVTKHGKRGCKRKGKK